MKVIIPMAGSGTRLRPHTYTTPKALVYVAGRPVLEYILDELYSIDFSELILIVGDNKEQIRSYMQKNHSKLNVRYVEQKEPLGLGHAISLADEFAGGESVLITLGDTIFEVDINLFLGSDFSLIGVKEVENPTIFGIVELEDGFVKRLVEKPKHPPTNLAISGLYYIKNSKLLFECLSEIIEKDIRTKNEYQLTDALELMVESGEKLKAAIIDGWYDCGNPERLLATNRYLLEKRALRFAQEVKRTASQYDFPEALIIPPVYIAESVRIENSIIGPHASIGYEVEISNSIVKDSIINPKAKIENIMLNKSLVGENAVIVGQFKEVNVGDTSKVYL